ncbi:MAG: dihydropteroate synthase-like protein [Methanoregulaceae archaeon]|nr:dihydropteroate synthase-like protein [Methanoregulaceae archaeon]
MRVLLPTGTATYDVVKQAASVIDADVVVTGEIASFVTPAQLRDIIKAGTYDMVIVPGMSTADFRGVEEETGVAVFRGPRHAADLVLILPALGNLPLSRDVPADEFISSIRRGEAAERVRRTEAEAECRYLVRGVKIGGNSRIKVLAEIMDAHHRANIREVVERYFAEGADIVDLGFGFDATPGDVEKVFASLTGIEGPLAADTQDPDLIAAALQRADIILSLHDGNIPLVGDLVSQAGACAVLVPGAKDLEGNIRLAEAAGITAIIADPLLQPVGSGLAGSLAGFSEAGYPLFFGAGNVAELIDADSIGVNALLAGIAMELHAAVIFTAEHSDKTSGSISEMRRATEMMMLARDRPYPKDLGTDLLVIKEKRRRREPAPEYASLVAAPSAPSDLELDPCGNFRIGIEGRHIVAVIGGRAVTGSTWDEVFYAILRNGDVSLLDHAAYLGKELYKAELAIRFGRSFEQDGPF